MGSGRDGVAGWGGEGKWEGGQGCGRESCGGVTGGAGGGVGRAANSKLISEGEPLVEVKVRLLVGLALEAGALVEHRCLRLHRLLRLHRHTRLHRHLQHAGRGGEVGADGGGSCAALLCAAATAGAPRGTCRRPSGAPWAPAKLRASVPAPTEQCACGGDGPGFGRWWAGGGQAVGPLPVTRTATSLGVCGVGSAAAATIGGTAGATAVSSTVSSAVPRSTVAAVAVSGTAAMLGGNGGSGRSVAAAYVDGGSGRSFAAAYDVDCNAVDEGSTTATTLHASGANRVAAAEPSDGVGHVAVTASGITTAPHVDGASRVATAAPSGSMGCASRGQLVAQTRRGHAHGAHHAPASNGHVGRGGHSLCMGCPCLGQSCRALCAGLAQMGVAA